MPDRFSSLRMTFPDAQPLGFPDLQYDQDQTPASEQFSYSVCRLSVFLHVPFGHESRTSEFPPRSHAGPTTNSLRPLSAPQVEMQP